MAEQNKNFDPRDDKNYWAPDGAQNEGKGDSAQKGGSRSVDLAEAENSATEKPSNKDKSASYAKSDQDGLYAPEASGSRGAGGYPFTPNRMRAWFRARRGRTTGVLVLGLLGISMLGLISFVTPALELFHVKEVLTQRVGEIQSLVVKTRSGKLYSRAFFFDEGGFDGYKSRGSVFSVYDNYKTTNLLEDIRAADSSFNIDYNQRTGRVNSVSWTDTDGTIQTVGTAGEFETMWNKRSGIRAGLEEAYPDKSSFWRSRQARKLYARSGLSYTLSNVLENSRLAQSVDDLAARLGRTFTPFETVTAKLRKAMFGDIFDNYQPSISRISSSGQDQPVDPDVEIDPDDPKLYADDLGDLGDDITEAAADVRSELADGDPLVRPSSIDSIPTPSSRGILGNTIRGSPAEVTATLGEAAARAATIGIVVDASEKVCRVKFLLDAAEIGARTVRGDMLSENFTLNMGIADAGKVGDLTSDSMDGMMARIQKVDHNGDSFYSGGGWSWATGGSGIVNPDNIDKFSVGGGSVETLSYINEFLSTYGGGGLLDNACGLATNVIFQIVVGVGEAAVTYAPCLTGIGCGFTAAKLATGVTLGVAREASFTILEAIFRPILVRMAAGAVVDQLEVGPEMSDALVSGASAWFGRRSSSAGMRPLTPALFSQLEERVHEERKQYFAQQSIFDRLLNPTNTDSLAFKSIIKIPRSFSSILSSFKNLTFGFNPVKTLAYATDSALAGSAIAAVGNASAQCTDPAIDQQNIATDPFCNPIYGEDLAALDQIDPLDNIVWMIDEGYIESDVDNNGDVVYGENTEYEEYVAQCFENNTPLRDNNNNGTSICFEDGPANKYLRFRTFRLDRDLSTMIAQDINRDYGGYIEPSVDVSTTTPGIESNVPDPESVTSGIAGQRDISCTGTNVSPGQNLNSILNGGSNSETFCLSAGTYTGQTITPKSGQTIVGALGTVLDGGGSTTYAFTGDAPNVTIKNFIITGYNNPQQKGAIHDGGPGWVVEGNEIYENAGAGVRLTGDGAKLIDNFIHHNRQLGVAISNSNNILVEGNEISYNNYNVDFSWGWEAGGTKFARNTNLTIRDNYSHHNHGPGLWTDIDNYNVLYEGNIVEDNYATGIFHEISYKATIRNNQIRRNGFGHTAWLWGAGIQIASSQDVEVYGNTLEGNNNGISISQQNRGSGDRGPYIARNNSIHDNTVSGGKSGAVQDIGTSAIFNDNNVWYRNTYAGPHRFAWNNDWSDFARWVQYHPGEIQ